LLYKLKLNEAPPVICASKAIDFEYKDVSPKKTSEEGEAVILDS